MDAEIKVTPEIANQVENMILAAMAVSEINKCYPKCWDILKHQFRLKDYNSSDFIEDDIQNVKIRLYAEIITKNTVDQKKVEAAVAKKLNKS